MKRALLEAAGLPHDEAAMKRPVIGMVTRLTHQKGCDLVAAAADRLMGFDATWVMLGSGDAWCEDLWQAAARRVPRPGGGADRVRRAAGAPHRGAGATSS